MSPIFANRDRALRTVLRFCEAYNPPSITKRYKYHEGVSIPKTCATTDVRVLNADALDVALSMRDPLVLILADDIRPGGCIHAGAGMQEESLFRRTALFAYLRSDLYPLGPDEALYARHVPVLLTSEMTGYQAHGNRRISFIACPGVKMPQLVGDRLSADDEDVLRCKVRLILQVAAENGVRSGVVCGAVRPSTSHRYSWRSCKNLMGPCIQHTLQYWARWHIHSRSRYSREALQR
jgi:hypothetical protein